MTGLVYFSFVGTDPRTQSLNRCVVELARRRFPQEYIADFGDPLANWGDLRIGDQLKRDMQPMERLGHRGSLLLGSLRRSVLPKKEAGATLGFVERLGFDTWAGANGYTLDMRTLDLWEAFVEHGILAMGLTRPYCYFHTDGNDRLAHLLQLYCERLPGQRYVTIPWDVSEDEQAARVLHHVATALEARDTLAA